MAVVFKEDDFIFIDFKYLSMIIDLYKDPIFPKAVTHYRSPAEATLFFATLSI